MNLRNLPTSLIYSRLFLGILIGLIAIINPVSSGLIIAILMFVGILTDIFDGIIARKLGVSSEQLRVLDSLVDLFFWLISIGAVFYLVPQFFLTNYVWILLILALEFLAYLISLVKFNKPIATHTYLAKLWSVFLFCFLAELAIIQTSTLLFWVVIILGCISRLEIIFILRLLKHWKTDVSSIFDVKN